MKNHWKEVCGYWVAYGYMSTYRVGKVQHKEFPDKDLWELEVSNREGYVYDKKIFENRDEAFAAGSFLLEASLEWEKEKMSTTSD